MKYRAGAGVLLTLLNFQFKKWLYCHVYIDLSLKMIQIRSITYSAVYRMPKEFFISYPRIGSTTTTVRVNESTIHPLFDCTLLARNDLDNSNSNNFLHQNHARALRSAGFPASQQCQSGQSCHILVVLPEKQLLQRSQQGDESGRWTLCHTAGSEDWLALFRFC